MQTTQHTAIKPCSPDPSAPANGTRERPHRLSRRRCPSRRGAARGRVPQVLGHPGARRGAFGRRNHPAHVDAVPGWICGHGAGQKGEIAIVPDHPVAEGPDPLDVGGENVTQRRPVTSRQAHEERSDDLDDIVLRRARRIPSPAQRATMPSPPTAPGTVTAPTGTSRPSTATRNPSTTPLPPVWTYR